jgi:hypothetical protein
METKKLATNKLYRIVSIKEIQTKFGTTYILTDDKYDDYFSTNKITKYIQANGISNDTNKKFLFTIRTGLYKTFTNEDGNEFKYLDCKIY